MLWYQNRCSSDVSCLAYGYHQVADKKECQLIYNNSTQGRIYATGVYRKGKHGPGSLQIFRYYLGNQNFT